jgi:hypothetical protein
MNFIEQVGCLAKLDQGKPFALVLTVSRQQASPVECPFKTEGA